VVVACTAFVFGVDVKRKKTAWHYIPDAYNLRSFSPPNINIVHIWLECCDQDIADERLMLGVDTCSTLE
jgi:hypothetical protein